MKKTSMLIAIVAIAVGAFLTAIPRSASSAPRPYAIANITDYVTMNQYAGKGWIIRAATVCPTSGGSINSSSIQCVVFQAP
jgi:hypothetical protein